MLFSTSAWTPLITALLSRRCMHALVNIIPISHVQSKPYALPSWHALYLYSCRLQKSLLMPSHSTLRAWHDAKGVACKPALPCQETGLSTPAGSKHELRSRAGPLSDLLGLLKPYGVASASLCGAQKSRSAQGSLLAQSCACVQNGSANGFSQQRQTSVPLQWCTQAGYCRLWPSGKG